MFSFTTTTDSQTWSFRLFLKNKAISQKLPVSVRTVVPVAILAAPERASDSAKIIK